MIDFDLKRGRFEPLGVSANRLANAVTGQRIEFDSLGTVISLISLFVFMVLDILLLHQNET